MTADTRLKSHQERRSPVLGRSEAAAYLGVGLRTLQMLTEQGKIPRLRLSPRRIGYLRKDIDAYLERQRR